MKKLLILIVLFFITGCWNYNELNELAITTAIGIDKKDNNYEVSILVANAKNKSSSGESTNTQNIVYSASGKTLSEAIKNIELKNPRKTYIGHLSSLIISEEVAKEGLINVLDLLFRNSESIKRFYLIIAKDVKAKDVLKIISPLEAFPAQTITNNIKSSSETQAISIKVVYSDFIDKLIKKGIEPILPSITVIGSIKEGSKNSNLEQSQAKSYLKLGTVAIFKGDKLVSFATKNESRGINLVLNKTERTTIRDGCINIEITNIKSNISVSNDIDVSIKTNGEIIENNYDINLEDYKEINKIKKNFEKHIKNLVNKAFIVAKKNKTDIFGIGNILYKNNYKKFNSIKDWNDYFSNMKVNIKVSVNLSTKGSSRQSLKEELK